MDEDGNVYGDSVIAARTGITAVTFSRIGMAIPGMCKLFGFKYADHIKIYNYFFHSPNSRFDGSFGASWCLKTHPLGQCTHPNIVLRLLSNICDAIVLRPIQPESIYQYI
jgi:hypothetical protein